MQFSSASFYFLPLRSKSSTASCAFVLLDIYPSIDIRYRDPLACQKTSKILFLCFNLYELHSKLEENINENSADSICIQFLYAGTFCFCLPQNLNFVTFSKDLLVNFLFSFSNPLNIYVRIIRIPNKVYFTFYVIYSEILAVSFHEA
jgi:hypothetical protein